MYLRKTNEKTFQSTNEPNIYLNTDSGMKDCDTRDKHAKNTVVADQKETPDEQSGGI